jgi:hypothetical protein
MPAMDRRSFLRVGALCFGGPLLAELLRQEAVGKSAETEKRSVILVFQPGGPSHLETWDMKPDAPVEYRGESKSIPTHLPGYRVGEYTPRLARRCDRLAVLRSVYHDQTEHGQACHLFMTGYRPTKNDPGNEFPSCGSIVSKELGPRKGEVPPSIATMTAIPSSNASYLGIAHNPFQTFGYPTSPSFQVRNLQLPDGVDVRRLERRREMLEQFDTLRREADASGALEGMDAFTRQAFEMVGSPAVQKALDLNQEPKALRERYGVNSFGAQSMVAGHTHHGRGVAWRADGKVLASCGADNVPKVWNAEDGTLLRAEVGDPNPVHGYRREVTAISFIGDSEILLGASGDKTLRLHHARSPQGLRTFEGQFTFLYCAAATADGKWVVAGGHDGVLRVWNGENGYLKASFPPPPAGR